MPLVRRFHLICVFQGERGSFLPLAAVALAIFAILGGAVLEIGQWYQHRRHLQVRADAAALAGGTLFNQCFDSAAFTPAQAAANMEALATQYSGIETGGVYNQGWQSGTSSTDSIGFQSNEYPSPGDTAASPPVYPPRDAFPPDSSECASLDLDVKLAQGNLPNVLSISPLKRAQATARVEEQQVKAEKPSLPIAIPNFDLSQVGVTFFNEATGLELTTCTGALAGTTCTYKLSGPTDATGQDGEAVSRWTLPASSITLPTPSTSSGNLIGVRVSAGTTVGSCAPSFGTGNNLYACFDLNSAGSGLVGIRDYPTTNQTTPPLYEVWPSDSCSSDTSPFFSDLTGQSTCTVTLQAYVGETANCSVTPPNNATLTATLPANLSITLSRSSTCTTSHGGGAWLWSGSTTLPIDANSTQSEYPVTLAYKKGATTTTWNGVQRFTSGSLDDDGPIRMISLSSASGNPYSASAGSDSVGVTVVTSQAGISKQLVVLRQAHNGSSTAFILCYDGGSHNPYSPEQGDQGVEDGMQFGCSFSYALNQSLASADPCATQPLPPQCVPNKTSNAGGNPLVTKTLNARFGCTNINSTPTYPNNWPNFSKPGDTRAVTLLLTSYNAYGNGGKTNGKQMYPVVGFGDFYVSGFSGSKCHGDDPAPPQVANDNANAGDIWGYFIKYDSGAGIPSGRKCVPNALGACVAVLVR